MLKRCSTTYTRSFTGYFISNGCQVKLFQTFNSDDVERLCKEFSLKLSPSTRVYVEELFVMHYISTFNF